MKTIDIHAHLVPRSAWQAAANGRAWHGFRHTAIIHSRNLDTITTFGRRATTTLFVVNGASPAGLGLGGQGYLSYSIATPTGEGITTTVQAASDQFRALMEANRVQFADSTGETQAQFITFMEKFARNYLERGESSRRQILESFDQVQENVVERIEGAAARSELRRGDVVLAIVVGGRQTRLETLGDFERVVAALTPGRQVTLLMQRGGTSSYISLRAGD